MKLTLVGGAGVRTPLLISALARRQSVIGVDEVCLVDIDVAKLSLIGPLARHVAQKTGASFDLRWTGDLEDGLHGANAVITTIRAGGDASRAQDERVALEHGVIGQETTGAAGFAMAIRSIPAVSYCARLMLEVCPDAWLLNFTNPAGLVTQALVDAFPGLKIVGICDTPISLWRDVARLFDRSPRDMPISFFGLNHLSWMRSAWVDGRDVVPGLCDDASLPARIHELSMFDPELLKLIGMIPNEYLYYYYYRNRALSHMTAAPESRGEQVQRLGRELLADLADIDPASHPDRGWERYAAYRDSRHGTYMAIETGGSTAVAERPHMERSAPTTEEGEGYAGVALDILAAAATGEESAIVANVPNRGAVAGMRDDDVVEVVCRCNASGLQPLPQGDVPVAALTLMRTVKLYERLTVEAVRLRSRELAIEALMAHPLVGSYPIARSLATVYLRMHGATAGEW